MMWAKAWTVARHFLLETTRDRISWIWLLAFPILWITLVSAFYGAGSDQVSVGLVLLDSSPYAQIFQEALNQEKGLQVKPVASVEEARQAVEEGDLPLALVVPVDFGDRLTKGETIQLAVIRTKQANAYYLDEVLNQATRQVAADAFAARFALEKIGERTTLSPSQAESLWTDLFHKAEAGWQSPPLQVSYQVLAGENQVKVPEGANQASPGFTAMFVMMGLFFGAGSMVEERRNRTLQRLLISPTPRFSLLFGKFLGFFLLGALQLALLILFGQFVLGTNWGSNPWGIVLVGGSFLLASVGLGTLLAALVHTPQQADAFSILLSIVLAMLGGSWWPVEILSPTLQTVAQFSPVYWAINGFNRLITYGQGVPAILPNVFILLIIAAISLTLGIILFRNE